MKVNTGLIINFLKQNTARPMTFEEIAIALEVHGQQKNHLLSILLQLEKNKEVKRLPDGRYAAKVDASIVTGTLKGSPEGYAFLIPENRGESREPHVYINSRDMAGAVHGDQVEVRITTRRKGERPEGVVTQVLKRGHPQIVGTLEAGRRSSFVAPDDFRFGFQINIAPDQMERARPKDKVVVEITHWSESGHDPSGKVIEVLGPKGSPGVDIDSLLRQHNLHPVFPRKVLQEAEHLPSAPEEHEKKGRQDFRGQMVVTIDGEDAKDFDDAVSLESLPGGLTRLFVHIADVSYYVRPGSPLDEEAFERGTSVYLPDRVVPMLPEALSNNLCSLIAGQDRLTQSAIMDIDQEGTVVSYDIVDSIIHVTERMTYEKVQAILDGDEEQCKKYKRLVPMFKQMQELALLLRRRREKDGSLDFDLPESRVVLDEQGRAIGIKVVRRLFSHLLIEDFMLTANRTVAKHMAKKELPFIYRIHEPPDEERLTTFLVAIRSLGIATPQKSIPTPHELQRTLKGVVGKPQEELVNMLLLRSMKLAIYSIKNLGHFGLGFDFYTHFTSPIRRYPDLLVHRLLRESRIHPAPSAQERAALNKFLEEAARVSSLRERDAEDVEEECVKLKKIEYMKGNLGEEYHGVISGVQSYGFFVEIKELLVEGLVHVSALQDDFYEYTEAQQSLTGKRTRKVYRMGSPVKVRVARVDLDKKQIDFALVEERGFPRGTRHMQGPRSPRGPRHKRRGRR